MQARRLRRAARDGDEASRVRVAREFAAFFARETAEHFREEEELLFPLLAGRLEAAQALLAETVAAGSGTGPLWGTASEDLNATLLAWRAKETTPEQANDERDVLLVGIEGTGGVRIEGEAHAFGPARTVIVPKGATFQIAAGAGGLRYLSVHLRRPRLQIAGRVRGK